MRFPYLCSYCLRARQWLFGAACRAPQETGFYFMCSDCHIQKQIVPKAPTHSELGALYTQVANYKVN